MPRTKKPAGQAVDRRNGRQAELSGPGNGLEWFVLPPRRPAWAPEAHAALAALREDPVSQVITPVDGPVLLRWLDSIDRAGRAMRRADRTPVVIGGNGQVTEHPSYQTARTAIATAEKCEVQLGVGAKNRAALGLTITAAQKSLEELNAMLIGGDTGDDDYDPRG